MIVGSRASKACLLVLVILTGGAPAAESFKMARRRSSGGGGVTKPARASTVRRREPTPPVAPPVRTRRGTVTDEEGVRFEGWFNAEGELHGRGTMHFPDGGWQTCSWDEGVPNGVGEYVGDDLSIIRGTWVEGELQGHVEEYACGGFLVYAGPYADSRRHGKGVLKFQDGSRIEGPFVEGTLNGTATFTYPDGVSGFTGLWKDGDMHHAQYWGPEPQTPPLVPDSTQGSKTKKAAAGWRDIGFASDETSETNMGEHLLLRDPYESRHCRVGRSGLCETPLEGNANGNSAGEGLFATCDIVAEQLVCYYNGVRVPHTKVDKRAWRSNDNCISLDANCAIDVPNDYASMRKYCATVGHKANHSFQPNSKYVEVYHARFGHIKGIRAIRGLKSGEEVLVDYGYTDQMPKWYRQVQDRFKLENKHL